MQDFSKIICLYQSYCNGDEKNWLLVGLSFQREIVIAWGLFSVISCRK